MDFWVQNESRTRRDDALENVRRNRLARLGSSSGRRTRLRVRIANGAQAMSDLLAALARTLRSGESA